MIQELANAIVAILQQNNGSMTYSDLLATIDQSQRAYLPQALAYGKATGSFNQIVAWNNAAKTVSHTVVVGGN